MRKNKKLLSFFLCLAMFIFYTNFLSLAFEEDISLTATNAIAVEYKTGEVLFGKNEYKKIYPASTTKVWTAYLTIKNIEDLDEIIEVTNDVSWVEPSSMYLKVGEKFTVRQLLEVLMLKSANDVAVVLAERISGSVEDFAQLMNEEARKIGCTDTNFVNPNGLPDENHYSTPYDMALIAREALKSDILREIANTKYIVIPANDIYPYTREYKNSNKFLTGGSNILYKDELIDVKYNIVEGLKTGYTSAAGRCLLSNAVVDDTEVIVGVFNSKGDDVYIDSRTIIDYTLEKYKTIVVLEKNNFKAVKSIDFFDTTVEGYIAEDYAKVEDITFARNDNIYEYDIHFMQNLELPIKKDSTIGEVSIKENGHIIDSIPLLAKNDVYRVFPIVSLYIIVVVLCVFLFTIVRCKHSAIKKRQRMITQRNNTLYERRR